MSDVAAEIVRRLIREIGEAGVEQVHVRPGLAAAVDQHVAAVRNAVARAGDEPTEQVLLDYLYGFADEAIERGWWPEDDFDWETVRVIAVCSMMRDARSAGPRTS